MDPYKVLNIPKNFTLEQLREQYKKMALQVHPDKGGSAELFDLVTSCYKKLLRHQERKIEKDFMELKKEFKQFDLENKTNTGVHAELAEMLRSQGQAAQQAESPSASRSQPDPRSRSGGASSSYGSHGSQGNGYGQSQGNGYGYSQSQGPDIRSRPAPSSSVDPTDVFNRVFEENRMDDAYAAGYGSMMTQSSPAREDINIPNTMRSFKINKFNKSFENQPVSAENQTAVTVYKQPEPTLMAKKIAFSELGVATINDFSGANESRRHLNYTDYLKAHTTTRLIDPRTVKERQQYKTVGELEAHRGNTNMTDEELQDYAAYQDALKESEIKRVNTLQKQDRAYEQHYERVNQRMLEQMRR
jgi:curved DNA-binding protein CbpA